MSSSRSPAALYSTAQFDPDRIVLRYPLGAREPTHYTVSRRGVVNVANYAPETLNTAHASPYGSAYNIGDVDITEIDRLKIFDRVYATIPATWFEPTSYSFRYPALPLTVTLGATVSASASNNSSTGVLTVTKSSHGLSDGDKLYVRYTYSLSSGVTVNSGYWAQVASATTNTFVAAGMKFLGSGYTFTAFTYATADSAFGRSFASDRVVDAVIRHDYFLPGVSSGISGLDDISLEPILNIIDADGNATDSLSTTTQPTAAEWGASILAGEKFVVATHRQPYLGKIVERLTTYIPYL